MFSIIILLLNKNVTMVVKLLLFSCIHSFFQIISFDFNITCVILMTNSYRILFLRSRHEFIYMENEFMLQHMPAVFIKGRKEKTIIITKTNGK